MQAIARTNRVKQGKQRGYIVDYIGLTENLTDALTLYAAADEQQELALGLKNIASEMPVLEERYQRLLQLFANHKVTHLREFVEGTLRCSRKTGQGKKREQEGSQFSKLRKGESDET